MVYDLTVLDDIRAGKTPIDVDDELTLVTQAEGSSEQWDADSLLHSLGV